MKCKIVETPCYPNSFKVMLPKPYRDDNSVSRFFPTKQLAEKEAEKIDKYIQHEREELK